MAYNNEAPKCDYIHAHPEIIQAVTSQMPDEELLYDWRSSLRFLEIRPGLRFFMYCWKAKCAYATLRSF